MTRKKLIRLIAILFLAGIIIGGGSILYVFKSPHRNIEKAKVDYSITASDLVQEYLNDNSVANEKYLAADGNSKILELSGTISKLSENLDGQLIMLLKSDSDKAGVQCSFGKDSNGSESSYKVGDLVNVKGVIRSGAGFDEDLGLYENVIVEKCMIVQ